MMSSTVINVKLYFIVRYSKIKNQKLLYIKISGFAFEYIFYQVLINNELDGEVTYITYILLQGQAHRQDFILGAAAQSAVFYPIAMATPIKILDLFNFCKKNFISAQNKCLIDKNKK